MRKIILNVAVSLDGFIEGPKGEFDWCFTDQDYGMTRFLEQTDMILLGRKSYEVLITLGEDAFAKHQKIVFSQTLKNVTPPYILSTEPAEQAVARLRQSEGKDIWLFGGASLTASLLEAGLVDELLLAVHPVLLGSGKSLVAGINNRLNLELLEHKGYSSGLIQSRYAIRRGDQ
ncbi:MAG: dihydrofolate reductase [Bacteroidetes bacterium]|nr:MAG: dihydrofolate reductase [Bacteroidota bacterium]